MRDSKKAVSLIMKRHGFRLLNPYRFGFERDFLHEVVKSDFVVVLGKRSDKKDSLVSYAVASKLLKIYKHGGLKMDSLSVYPDMDGAVVYVSSSISDINGKHILFMLQSRKSVILDVNSRFELKEIFGKDVDYILEKGVVIDAWGKTADSNSKRPITPAVSFAE